MALNKFYRFGMIALVVFSANVSFGQKAVKGYPVAERLASYKKISLKTDTALLSEAERKCLVHLIKAAQKVDEIFWKQAFKEKSKALAGIKNDTLRRFVEINYGPWDRLNDDKPFLQGYGAKPKGGNFYPENFDINTVSPNFRERLMLPYSIVKPLSKADLMPPPPKKGEKPKMQERPMMMERFPLTNGNEIALIEYNSFFEQDLQLVLQEMMKAATAIEKEDKLFSIYLRERAMSITSNQYIMSDIKWMTLKSHLDIVIGPIENYEDKLLGTKTSFEAYVLVRDREWGAKLEKYVSYLPELQANIPVEAAYKPAISNNTGVNQFDENGNIMPSGDMIDIQGYPPIQKPNASLSQLAVFDAVYYAGDCNAGSKTIAVNLPNDEVLQKYYGTRRSQLKNTMKAKFEEMVKPISQILVDPSQHKNILFDAFFANVMFHEVAHGLGVKNLVADTNKTVREALGADYSAIEECKADVLGLYMVTQLFNKGELTGSIDDYYVTFVASVFRSVRFGAASAHGKANMITFNTLLNSGCIVNGKKGYTVNVVAMKVVIEKLAAELLHLQGDGDKSGVGKMLLERGIIKASLQEDLAKLEKAKIPVDIIFDQGIDTLGLKAYDEADKSADKKEKK